MNNWHEYERLLEELEKTEVCCPGCYAKILNVAQELLIEDGKWD